DSGTPEAGDAGNAKFKSRKKTKRKNKSEEPVRRPRQQCRWIRALARCALILCRRWLFALGQAGNWARLRAQGKLRLPARNGGGGRRRRQRLFRQRLAFHEELKLGGVENFAVEQRLGDAFECIAIGLEDAAGAAVSAGHDVAHFVVDFDGRVFGIVAMLRDFASEENRLFLLPESERAEAAHAPFADHLARDLSGAFDIVSGAGGEVIEENFLGGAPAHEHGE